MALTWFKNGNEYRSLDGRWTIWGDDRRGFTLDHTLDDGERISWSVPGAFDSVEEAKKQAERASRKSLPATETKAMELRAKYKAARKKPYDVVCKKCRIHQSASEKGQRCQFCGGELLLVKRGEK